MSKLVNTYAWGRATTPIAPLISNVAGIRAAIAKGDKVINLDPKGTFTVTSPIYIDVDGVVINGNCAKITRQGNTTAENFATLIINKSDVVVKDLIIYGCQSANINKTAFFESHFGIVLYNAMRASISNCSFKYFNGAGIVCCSAGTNITYGGFMLGSADWDLFRVGTKIINNKFELCMVGLANTFRYEYSNSSNNSFYNCGCGVWDESGNWIHTSNLSAKTLHGFISNSIPMKISFTHKLAGTIISSSANYFGTGNNSHGNINGFTANHSIDLATTWDACIVKTKDDGNWNLTTHIGKSYCGVVGYNTTARVIPPNINNIVLYYGGLAFRDIQAPANVTYKWNVFNVVVSGVSDTNKGGIRCDVANNINVVGFASFNLFFENINVVVK